MDKSYKVAHIYIDKGSISHESDQFLRWINIPGSGMRNADGIRALNYVDRKSNSLPAYIILVSHEVKRHGNPWEDVVDYTTSSIKYWGDAKHHPSLGYEDFRGNKRLLQTWHAVLDGDLSQVPPILHFTKPQKGIVKFTGLCSLSNLELTWFEDKGNPVKNYRCELTILDAERIEVQWLHSRAYCADGQNIHKLAPNVWKEYVKGKIRKLDIWSNKITKKQDQLPLLNSREAKLLEQLRSLSPTQFEAVVVELFRELPHVNHKIFRTRPTADGGFDFYGQFSIPYPVKYNIEFLGEAKKFARSSPVQPKHVSRLVARLGRGQFGIFVTTSYYTAQTQKEVLADGYPVKLFSGVDLVNILLELRLADNKGISQTWLNETTRNIT